MRREACQPVLQHVFAVFQVRWARLGDLTGTPVRREACQYVLQHVFADFQVRWA